MIEQIIKVNSGMRISETRNRGNSVTARIKCLSFIKKMKLQNTIRRGYFILYAKSREITVFVKDDYKLQIYGLTEVRLIMNSRTTTLLCIQF